MIDINLRDDHLQENLQAIMELRSIGFTDDEIQKLYDRQFEKDQRSDNNAE
jgi:hypothetical protein